MIVKYSMNKIWIVSVQMFIMLYKKYPKKEQLYQLDTNYQFEF